MTAILFSWIGQADLDSSTSDEPSAIGPIGAAAKWAQEEASRPSKIVLLSNYPAKKTKAFADWLLANHWSGQPLEVSRQQLSNPMDFEEIHTCCTEVLKQHTSDHKIYYHLSPGTSAMATIWALLGKTRFPGVFIRSSIQEGVSEVEIPFDVSAEFVSGRTRVAKAAAFASPPKEAKFGDIIFRSAVMHEVVKDAKTIAAHDVPVLLQGESGTGKELFARAIHSESKRAVQPFEAINCGALPEALITSELFGHEKGAFTGADSKHLGAFERAHRGTLFLDEIGELPLPQQVHLLRALQEGEIRPLGAKKTRKVDVRIIAATNRDLVDEIANRRFREDLFYRLAVGTLRLPPLRERSGDLGVLIDHFLCSLPSNKTFSAGARNLMLQQQWPGNVRELQNTVTRASMWAEEKRIDKEATSRALLNAQKQQGPLPPLGEGFNLQEVLDTIQANYITEALKLEKGVLAHAAAKLGLNNYQTLRNRMKKLGIENDLAR